MFKNFTICISGKLSEKRSIFEKKITSNLGKISKSITNSTTHLISTKEDFEEKSNVKIKKAIEKKLIIVNEDWINDSVNKKELQDSSYYLLDSKKRKRNDSSNESSKKVKLEKPKFLKGKIFVLSEFLRSRGEFEKKIKG
jgi:hypothetical protein